MSVRNKPQKNKGKFSTDITLTVIKNNWHLSDYSRELNASLESSFP